MRRAKTTQNLYDKKHTEFEFDGIWKETFGNPDTGGAWLIWGDEKNGKTWVTLIMANYLSGFRKLHYISAEEGTGKDFVASVKRAQISPLNKQIHYEEYEPIEDVQERLGMRNAPRIVIIDNITVYNDELKNGGVKKLLRDFPDVLFIFLAHEERGEPYTATAKLVRKLAKVIIKVEGLVAVVSGRCPGGRLIVDKERALLYHGHEVLNGG